MRKRQLSVEALEKRLVLSGVGQPDADQSGADWQSVIVSFKDDVANPGAAASALVRSFGGQLGHVYEHALKGFSAYMPAAAVQGLSHNPQVKLVEPDLVMTAFGQTVPTGVNRIEADLNLDGTDERVNVNVAIIDSGIDSDHPDLNVKGGKHFWSVVSGPPSRRGNFSDDKYEDDNGHGTHVAGTIGALDDEKGVVGVAPGANLYAVKVLDASGVGYESSIIAGIDWVTATRNDTDQTNDIDVVNMSLGGQGFSPTYQDAIHRSVEKGIVYVVAAGNEYRDIHGSDKIFGTSDDTIPAAYPEVATISAFADTDGKPGGAGPDATVEYDVYDDDTFADFSNFSNSDGSENQWFLNNNPVESPGLGIDLMMPGVNIMSTYLNGGYATGSGTSMAAPHATGLVALYIAQNERAEDATGVYAIRRALIDAGKPWRSLDGLGLIEGPNPDSPDKYEENLGWAGPTEPVDAAPSVTFSNPSDHDVLIDPNTVTIRVFAADDIGVTQVAFFVDGVEIGPGVEDLENNGNWYLDWDMSALVDGTHTVGAEATDKDWHTGSDTITVTVDNIDDPPTVDITDPPAGATVSGTVTITADASDDRGIEQVEFFVGALSLGTDTDGTDGWSASWPTDGLSGNYQITATASDSTGQTSSDTVTVTVDNTVPSMSVILASQVTTIGKAKWRATVTATVVDDGTSAAPLEGATVVGNWSGAYTQTGVSGVTDGAGVVSFQTPLMTSGTNVTFTVTSVTHADYTYKDSYPVIDVPRRSTSSKAAELDALYQYLAETAQANKSKKGADDEIAAVDLWMAYGV